MKTFLPRWMGILVLVQLVLFSTARAEKSADRSHLFAKEVDKVLKNLKETKYQSKTVVDMEKGIFKGNCSGFIGHLLSQHFPEAYLTVRGKDAPWRKRPLAVTYYETFVAAGRDPLSKPGWRKVSRMMEAKPGDIIAWRKLSLAEGLHTGHIVMVAGKPVLEPDGRVRIRIVDSSSGRHFKDTRPVGVNGVGAGEMWFAINEAGEPTGYWLNEKSQRSKTNKIAVGRLVPIQRKGVHHPKATLSESMIETSSDLDFIGLSTGEATSLANKRKIAHRIIIDN